MLWRLFRQMILEGDPPACTASNRIVGRVETPHVGAKAHDIVRVVFLRIPLKGRRAHASPRSGSSRNRESCFLTSRYHGDYLRKSKVTCQPACYGTYRSAAPRQYVHRQRTIYSRWSGTHRFIRNERNSSDIADSHQLVELRPSIFLTTRYDGGYW